MNPCGQAPAADRPWAPFRSLVDFEFAETVVRKKLDQETTNTLLNGMHGAWSHTGSKLSFRNYGDVKKSLDAARTFVDDFVEGVLNVEYKGVPLTIKYYYRDPWHWTTSAAGNAELCKTHVWHSCQKFYCEGDYEERIIDDVNTGDSLWEKEDTLPAPDPMPHCIMPFIFWLDKALVGRKRKMHPMLVRPGWQPAQIRNASGNGGGLFIGFMPMVQNPIALAPEQSKPGRKRPKVDPDWAPFMRTIYHKILGDIFKLCVTPSHIGHAVPCGDGVDRVIYPSFHIKTVDGEEAHYLNCCRAATADFPCPKCLAYCEDLSRLSEVGEPRTTDSMKRVYERAEAAKTKAERDKILQEHGLHLVKDFLWEFGHTDPYDAYGYDKLHSDDNGKNGHHLWPLVRDTVVAIDEVQFNNNMGSFPRWPRVELFDPMKKPVSKLEFSDGETHLGIVKRLNPCIVQILPRNSSLVHWTGWYTWYRMLIGLYCISILQLEFLRRIVIPKYEYWSNRVGEEYEKNFAFFKQHAVAHVVHDILTKGALQNQDTRPSEGFQQEVKQQYRRTDRRDVEKQIARIDTEEEAIAHIRETIDRYNEEKRRELDLEAGEDPEPDDNYVWGSSSHRWADCTLLESQLCKERGPEFRGFEEKLRRFVLTTHPALQAELRGPIKIDICKCAYIRYSSVEDFREARDILRCNPEWYGRPRYDCALLDGPNKINVGRLQLLFRCKLSSGHILELAAVTRFSQSQWKPRTVWQGCRVFDEKPKLDFIAPKDIIRGALMCPAFGSPPAKHAHYLVDCIDGDMFLRVNELAVPFNNANFDL